MEMKKIHGRSALFAVKATANKNMRPNKLRRHIETKHPNFKNQPLQFFERKLAELKTRRKLLHFTKIIEKAMHTSYMISPRIAKAGKPHTIGKCAPSDKRCGWSYVW
jgi:hypothetical protein